MRPCNVVCKEAEESDVGLGDKWRLFVKLTQAVCERGSILEQMRWEIIILLPRGGGDYHGIGLLEPFWKVIKKFWWLGFHQSISTIVSMADLQ
jgi:hypothetical protein